jgi:hypothetical protein
MSVGTVLAVFCGHAGVGLGVTAHLRSSMSTAGAAVRSRGAQTAGQTLPTTPRLAQVQGTIPKREKKKKKVPMSVGESFTYLAKSQYIRDLAWLVVAYGISINLVEVTWKSKIKAQFPNPNDYSAFMGDFSTATGAVTFTMMIVSRFIFNKFGWGVAALITPTVLLITGALAEGGGWPCWASPSAAMRCDARCAGCARLW